MKTNVYIDAGNLYYGLLRNNKSAKWLDPLAFARALIRSDHVLGTVKFYTARVRTYPYDAESAERQRIYLRALSQISGLEIIEGYYNRNKVWMPAVSSACRNCKEATDGKVRIVKLEEKRTDVNIATDMLYDVFTSDVDAVAIISGDSDFIAPLDIIRHKFGKQVLVFDPHERFSDICYHASYYTHIHRDLPAKCQLPDIIPIGTHGRTIHPLLRGRSRLPRGGFSKPDISAPFGMRRVAPPPTPYLARSVENVIISEPTPGACPHMVFLPEVSRTSSFQSPPLGPGPTGSAKFIPMQTYCTADNATTKRILLCMCHFTC